MNPTERARLLAGLVQSVTWLRDVAPAFEAATATATPPRPDRPRKPAGGDGPPGPPDPTGDAARDPTEGLRLLAEWDRYLLALADAVDLPQNLAMKELRRVTPPELAPPRQKAQEHCITCARGRDRDGRPLEVPVDPDGVFRERCRNCGRWKESHGSSPPPGICEHWDHGTGPLTTHIVRTAFEIAGRTPPEYVQVSR